MTRFLRFSIVGTAGMAVQLMVIWVLTDWLRIPAWIATAAGVGAAVLHNYAWHRAWTWRDRARATSIVEEFLRFAGANGLVSLAGNVAVVSALTSAAHLGAAPASVAAIALCSLANFWLAGCLVFARGRR